MRATRWDNSARGVTRGNNPHDLGPNDAAYDPT